MARTPGSKNRNFPGQSLEQSLVVATAIQDRASGMTVSKLTLADLLDTTPGSSSFRELLLASRAYDLTTGGVNGDEFGLSNLGSRATGADEDERLGALKQAVLSVAPYREFLTQFNSKKVPTPVVFKEFLVKNAEVPDQWAQECMERILNDARYVGFTHDMKGSEYIALQGVKVTVPSPAQADSSGGDTTEEPSIVSIEAAAVMPDQPNVTAGPPAAGPPKKVFIAHGKNREPLEQLKAILDKFGVKYAVAVDEPNAGRPISAKVATLMREMCSSAIFIFTADELFYQDDAKGNRQEVWRPSENVVYELGAASVLYDRRIVIFKEHKVSFPSDFSDLGYISFQADSLNLQMGDLFSELVALDILEVRAKQ